MRNKVVFSLAAAALMLPMLGARTQEATPRPVVEWKFEEGTGTSAGDASGQCRQRADPARQCGLDGGRRGNTRPALWRTRGQFRRNRPPCVDTTRSFTVTACVKLNRIGGYQTFVSEDGQQISGFFLQLRDDNGEFAMTIPANDGAADNAAIAASDIAPMPNTWYHLAGVYDASAKTLALYVNGVCSRRFRLKRVAARREVR